KVHSDGVTPVTDEEKESRAVEIAEKLSDNNIWKSHGRPIGIDTLTNELKLKIIDYEKDEELNDIIGEYYDVLKEYMSGHRYNGFFQTRLFI
ncbi:MAG: serine dehydrogenasease, partial [Candidatus Fimenecus sp.]